MALPHSSRTSRWKMGQLQPAKPVGSIQNKDAKELGDLNRPNVSRIHEDTTSLVGHMGSDEQAEHDMTTCDRPVGDTSDSSDENPVFPLKKKKKQKHKSNAIPLTLIPIMRLPSPPQINGEQESEEERKVRRKRNSFLVSASREPAWYEDVFDKETIENTRMNLGSLTLRGHSKEEMAVILKNINNVANVEVGGTGEAHPKGKSVKWGEITVRGTKLKMRRIPGQGAPLPMQEHQ